MECGQELAQKSKFCHVCGTALTVRKYQANHGDGFYVDRDQLFGVAGFI
jgi:uncharacterized membrane protein YvbJ